LDEIFVADPLFLDKKIFKFQQKIDQIGIPYKETEENALVNFKFVQIKK
jgi:hypothetical protein